MTETDAGPWAALASVPYRRLFFATAAVVFGVMGQSVARGWLARELTGSNTGLGGVMLVFGASMLLATPWGGVAADRFSKRSVLFWSVTLLAISSLLVGVAVVTDVIEYWMLLVASGMQATAFAFFLPTRIAFITELVDPPMIRNAVVVAQMAVESMRVVAPALAGLLVGVAWFGVGGVFLLGAGTAVIALMYVLALPRSDPATVSTRSPVGELIDVAQYLHRTRGLLLIALTTIGVVMLGFPYLAFMPTIADEQFDVGATGYGVMSAIAGLGAVVAGVMNARVKHVRYPWRMIAAGGGSFGAATIALGAAPNFPLALAALFVLGAAGLVFQTSSQSLLLTMSSFEYHGRLQSMVVLGFSGFGLAALPLGMLADVITLRLMFVFTGTVILGITAAFALVRLRHRAATLSVELG